MTVAVLFARADSNYKTLPDVEVFDAERDARTYDGPWPVVAHPPCRAWGRLRAFANPRPDERNLGRLAVALVREFGGVLEHPAGSTLWAAQKLPRPGERDQYGGWTLAAPQKWWGHKAEKDTWFYVCGVEPSEMPALPVREIAADDSLLFMWGAWPKLFEAKIVMDGWGLEFKTCAFVWVKTNKRTNPDQASFFPVDSFDSFWGMGRWTRANTEFCLLGTRGKPKRESAGVHQIIYAPIAEHSRKPDETRDRILALAGDVPRVELFARRTAPGWDLWGNEVECDLAL